MIKLTSETMGYMTLFEKQTGATVKDCIANDEITFIIKEGEMGLAIGKNGSIINKIKNIIGKEVHVYEHSDDPKKFITNLFFPIKIKKVEIEDSVAKIYIDASEKKRAIGRGGKKINAAKEIIKRHTNIKDIKVI